MFGLVLIVPISSLELDTQHNQMTNPPQVCGWHTDMPCSPARSSEMSGKEVPKLIVVQDVMSIMRAMLGFSGSPVEGAELKCMCWGDG